MQQVLQSSETLPCNWCKLTSIADTASMILVPTAITEALILDK